MGLFGLCVRRFFPLFLFHRKVRQFFQQLHNKVLLHIFINGQLVNERGIVLYYLFRVPLLTDDGGLDRGYLSGEVLS